MLQRKAGTKYYLEDETHASPRKGGMGRIILHESITNSLEMIDPSGNLGQDISGNNLFAALSSEPPGLLFALVSRLVGKLEAFYNRLQSVRTVEIKGGLVLFAEGCDCRCPQILARAKASLVCLVSTHLPCKTTRLYEGAATYA